MSYHSLYVDGSYPLSKIMDEGVTLVATTGKACQSFRFVHEYFRNLLSLSFLVWGVLNQCFHVHSWLMGFIFVLHQHPALCLQASSTNHASDITIIGRNRHRRN
jgi:hypothetical protein